MRSVLSRAYGYQLQNFYQLRNSQKSNFVKMMKLQIIFCRQESSGRFRRLVLRAVAEDVISISAGAEHLGIGLYEMRQDLKTVIA